MSDPYKVGRWICACCGHDSSLEPHWKVLADHYQARVKELEARNAKLEAVAEAARDYRSWQKNKGPRIRIGASKIRLDDALAALDAAKGGEHV